MAVSILLRVYTRWCISGYSTFASTIVYVDDLNSICPVARDKRDADVVRSACGQDKFASLIFLLFFQPEKTEG